nr:MAG TPA: hypothetical protein [Bacteriophage sp.]
MMNISGLDRKVRQAGHLDSNLTKREKVLLHSLHLTLEEKSILKMLTMLSIVEL